MPQNTNCQKPWEHLYIKSNGDVLLCCTMSTLIGNLTDQTIEEIRESAEAEHYRQGMLEGIPYKECLKCKCFSPATLESYLKYID